MCMPFCWFCRVLAQTFRHECLSQDCVDVNVPVAEAALFSVGPICMRLVVVNVLLSP